MRLPLALQGSAALALRLDWAAPAAITLLAFFVYVNGAFFSTVSALHVDLSINFTAAHAIRDGQNPYGETALLERARELGSPSSLGGPKPFIYQTLFTSYIQPPFSALSIVPLTVLPWREATRLYLIFNSALLGAAVVLTLVTVRPTIPLRWAVAGAMVIVAFYSQIYGSFALGQVDATITFLLVLGLWGYARDKPAVTGWAIALGAAIKLVPVLLLLYFLWKREYRIVGWALGAGALLFVLSLAAVGTDTYWTYFSETVPGLLKGSTHYANVSIGGVYNRLFVKELGPFGPLLSLDEVPLKGAGRALNALTLAAVLGLVAMVIGRKPLRSTGRGAVPEQGYVLEYYLVVALSLLMSSVTWEFYVVWLLPLFLVVFLAPSRVLPVSGVQRALFLVAMAAVYIGLNYPGDHYLFDVNQVFYHPDWVPGIFVEDIVNLYPPPVSATGGHVSIVPLLRLTTLSILALALLMAVLEMREARDRAA